MLSLTATPSATNSALTSSKIAFASQNSLTVAIIGNMMQSLPYTDARHNARN